MTRLRARESNQSGPVPPDDPVPAVCKAAQRIKSHNQTKQKDRSEFLAQSHCRACCSLFVVVLDVPAFRVRRLIGFRKNGTNEGHRLEILEPQEGKKY